MKENVKWMLGFHTKDGDRDGGSGGMFFPNFDFWQPDKETCIAEGTRVLQELRNHGDARDWLAYGFTDPWEVERDPLHIRDSWFFRSVHLRDEPSEPER